MKHMAKIIIDARHYGDIMRQMRKYMKLTTPDAAALLHMEPREYKKGECGRALFDEGIMRRLFHAAFAMLIIKSAAKKF